MHPFCEYLDSQDLIILFGNIPEVLNASRLFVGLLRQYVPNYITAESTSLNPNSSFQPLQDITSNVGSLFLEYLPTMEKAFKVYCTQNEFQMNTFYRIQNLATPTVEKWLSESSERSKKYTKAWTLDSLLIKPTQRLLKYPLLLQSMLKNTSKKHPDYPSLSKALVEVHLSASRINSHADGSTANGISKADLDYNKISALLKQTPDADDNLRDMIKQFNKKYNLFKTLIGAIRGNIAYIQYHFDINNGLAHSWMNWCSLMDDIDSMNTKSNLKQYRRYAMFCLPFTTASSAHVSSNRMKNQVDELVIEPLQVVLSMYKNISSTIDERVRIHHYFKRYVSLKNTNPDEIEPETRQYADRFLRLHTKLKSDLPVFSELSDTLMEECMKKFLSIQRNWFRLVVDSTSNAFQLTLNDIRISEYDPIVEVFNFQSKENAAQYIVDNELEICHYKSKVLSSSESVSLKSVSSFSDAMNMQRTYSITSNSDSYASGNSPFLYNPRTFQSSSSTELTASSSANSLTSPSEPNLHISRSRGMGHEHNHSNHSGYSIESSREHIDLRSPVIDRTQLVKPEIIVSEDGARTNEIFLEQIGEEEVDELEEKETSRLEYLKSITKEDDHAASECENLLPTSFQDDEDEFSASNSDDDDDCPVTFEDRFDDDSVIHPTSVSDIDLSRNSGREKYVLMRDNQTDSIVFPDRLRHTEESFNPPKSLRESYNAIEDVTTYSDAIIHSHQPENQDDTSFSFMSYQGGNNSPRTNQISRKKSESNLELKGMGIHVNKQPLVAFSTNTTPPLASSAPFSTNTTPPLTSSSSSSPSPSLTTSSPQLRQKANESSFRHRSDQLIRNSSKKDKNVRRKSSLLSISNWHNLMNKKSPPSNLPTMNE